MAPAVAQPRGAAVAGPPPGRAAECAFAHLAGTSKGACAGPTWLVKCHGKDGQAYACETHLDDVWVWVATVGECGRTRASPDDGATWREWHERPPQPGPRPSEPAASAGGVTPP